MLAFLNKLLTVIHKLTYIVLFIRHKATEIHKQVHKHQSINLFCSTNSTIKHNKTTIQMQS